MLNDSLLNTFNVLDHHVNGFHSYSLAEPRRLVFASESLAVMLGVDCDDLVNEGGDLYLAHVYHEDREEYLSFLRRAAAGPQSTIVTRYRLVTKEGRILQVIDTMSVERTAGGEVLGHSALVDAGEIAARVGFSRNTRPKDDCGAAPCLPSPEGIILVPGEKTLIEIPHGVRLTLEAGALCNDGGQRTCDCQTAPVNALDETPAVSYHPPFPSQKAIGPDVFLRTFGFFDVFVDGNPIAFRNKKSKELLALLADRRGGFISSKEAISYLWEDEPANPVTLARYRKVALRLKNTLVEYGITDIVESVNGERRLVVERVRCDLYDYLIGADEHLHLFKGSYLSNYSWSETTLAQLTRRGADDY